MNDDSIAQTLNEWHSNISRAKQLHYRRSGDMERYQKVFGTLIILLSLASAMLSFFILGKDSSGSGSIELPFPFSLPALA